MAYRMFMVIREAPDAGSWSRDQIQAMAERASELIELLRPRIEWMESFLSDDRIFCIYLAEDEEIIRQHGIACGVPPKEIIEVHKMMNPIENKFKGLSSLQPFDPPKQSS